MATFYYDNATTDALWTTLGNWWTVSAGGTPAVSFPAVGDTVILTGNVTQSGHTVTVANLTITNFTLIVKVTVTASATFAGTAKNGALGVVTGPTVFNSNAENVLGANVVGACIFNTSAKNYGTVTGPATFNNASTNESGGVIEGTCSFNSTASHKAGATINGNPTFNASSTCAGAVTGAATFNTSASQTSTSVIVGQCAFNNASILGGTVTGSCTFLSTASVSSSGIIEGASSFVMFLGSNTCAGKLTCQTVTFFGSGTAGATSLITVTDSANFIASSNLGTVTGPGLANFGGASYNSLYVTTSTAAFYGTSYNGSAGVMTCDSVIFDASYNDGTITADLVTFDATSYNTGIVNSNDCRIYKSSGNSTGVIAGVGNFYGNTGSGIYANNAGGTVTGSSNSYWPAIYPVGGTVSVSSNYFGYAFLKGQAQVGVRGSVGPLGIADSVSLGSIYGKIGLIARGKMNVPVTLSRALCKSGVKGTLRLTTADAGFTVKQALSAIYSVWGSGCSDSCDTAYTARGSAALDILNGCMQEIILNAKELQYLSRETIDVSAGTTDSNNGLYYYTLPDNVQNVVGPVLLKTTSSVGSVAIRRQIIGVTTKSQLLNFASYYNTGGKTTIYGYFIERAFQATGDRSRVRVYVSASIASAILRMDVEREALRYTAADCLAGTVIPIPHQYAESLLLPLIREAASASTFASRRDSFPMYQAAAAAARTRFTMADPQNPALSSKPERERKP